MARVWPELRLFPEEVRDGARNGVVVVLGRVLARGGGMILDRPTGWVFQMRDGRIARLRKRSASMWMIEASILSILSRMS